MDEKHGINVKIADPGLLRPEDKTENLETMIRELAKEVSKLTEKNFECGESLRADLEAERQVLKAELEKANGEISALKDAIVAEYVDRWARRGGGGPKWP